MAAKIIDAVLMLLFFCFAAMVVQDVCCLLTHAKAQAEDYPFLE